MEFNPSQIEDSKLTHFLYQAGKEKALLERDWEIAEHSRLVILAEISATFEGCGVAEAERKARVSEPYKAHIQAMGDIRGRLGVARAKFASIDHEIRMRLAKQYEQRQEYKAGSIQT